MRQVPIMISNRHVHLTEETAARLFGPEGVHFDHYLFGDSGPFACKETLTVSGERGALERVRVLGPLRDYDQVELMRGDCIRLGLQAPVRLSGRLDGAARLTLQGPCGQVTLDACGIIAHRHIHVQADAARTLALTHGQKVRVRAGGERGVVFENVIVLVAPTGGTVMHVDVEEGNAAAVSNMDLVEILD